jgi:pimeloyl-ACP methyl ester carboxylesterase
MNAGDKTVESATVRAPGWVRMALELRAPLEFAASVAAAPWLASAPRGDGHPVIVYPGFLGSDLSTRPMRRLLRWLGHDVHGWGQGRNLTPSAEVLDSAQQRIEQLHVQQGRRISLVGWSLGGLYARELAKRVPHAVRIVVTLGSPFTGPAQASNAKGLFDRVNGRRPRVDISRESLRSAPPVPTTSIYSRSDGIVAWQCSVEQPGARAENIEVEASHTGLGVNPAALYALADRLAQAEGQWQPFERTGLRQLVYPDPRHGA